MSSLLFHSLYLIGKLRLGLEVAANTFGCLALLAGAGLAIALLEALMMI